MASLGQAKSLGGVGSILVLIAGFIPSAGFVVAIIGFILILIAVKYVSDAFTDRTIFNNMIIAVILAILGFVAFFVAVLGAIYSFVGIGGFSSFMPGTAPSAGFIALLTSIIIGWVIAWVFFLVGSIFLKRSYDTVAMKLNVGTFHTTGLLYLIGAALTIIFVGLVIVFIAEILQIVAFFSIPEQMPMGPQPMPGQMGTPPPPGAM
ncbi:DUF996 domain-containing protein [Candidatus Bathyarchaeota archaeon]|nr:MAG: DUF996 domain-containing protein [Candidatus Bathyarchaeota archaeon]